MRICSGGGEADRRVVDPPIKVQAATWSPGGTLDWWVRERREWLGRVRGADGKQRWVEGWGSSSCERTYDCPQSLGTPRAVACLLRWFWPIQAEVQAAVALLAWVAWVMRG
jgi:hypothetical protein